MRKITSQKISIAFLLCALLCAFASESFAQSPNPIQKQIEAVNDKPFAKIDSSRRCAAVERLDNFLIELLTNQTNATGYINVYGQKGETVKNYVLLWQIKRHIEGRNFDSNRMKITTGELRAASSTEFWIVPAGKQPPPVVSAEWDYKLSRNPQQLNSLCYFDDGFDDNDEKLLAEFLKHNADFNGEVRIEETSVKRYRKIAKTALANLVKNGVPRTRIKTVLLKTPPGPATYTVWIVPVSVSTGD
jgi:hypothetical protein